MAKQTYFYIRTELDVHNHMYVSHLLFPVIPVIQSAVIFLSIRWMPKETDQSPSFYELQINIKLNKPRSHETKETDYHRCLSPKLYVGKWRKIKNPPEQKDNYNMEHPFNLQIISRHRPILTQQPHQIKTKAAELMNCK